MISTVAEGTLILSRWVDLSVLAKATVLLGEPAKKTRTSLWSALRCAA